MDTPIPVLVVVTALAFDATNGFHDTADAMATSRPPGRASSSSSGACMSAPLDRVVELLRAGYPEGVPPHDYQPLLALLSKELTPTEAIDDAEVDRVRRHLRSVGWDGTT